MSAIGDFLADKLGALTPQKWNSLMLYFDGRFGPLEERADVEGRALDSILARGLQVIEDGIGPSITAAREAAEIVSAMVDLGMVLSATTSTTMTINTNQKTLVVPEGNRAQFAPAGFVLVNAGTTLENAFVGRRVSYDRTTGVLVLDVVSIFGTGTFSEWQIGPIATTYDLEDLRSTIMGYRDASAGSASAAATSAGTAGTAAGASVAARDEVLNIIRPTGAAEGTPITGRFWYDSSTSTTRVWNGLSWAPAVSASLGGIRTESGTFGASPTGVITVGGGYQTAMVWLNGVLAVEGTQYTANGTTIAVTSPVNGMKYFVWAYQANDDYYTKEQANTAFAPKVSPNLTGTPTAPTAPLGTNTTQIANTAYVRGEVAALVNAAPATLDTLAEIAASLGNNNNFAATMTAQLATKASATSLNASALTGTIPEGVIPNRLRETAVLITNWDAAVTNGFFLGNSAANGPVSDWLVGTIETLSMNYVVQTVSQLVSATASDARAWRRYRQNGNWTAWARLRLTQAEQDAALVKQGGGSDMSTNAIRMGWSSAGLRAQVDSLPLGRVWTDYGTGYSVSGIGYIRFANGFMLQWGFRVAGSGADHGVNFPTSFPSYCAHVSISPQRPDLTAFQSVSFTVDQLNTTGFAVRSRYADYGGAVGLANDGAYTWFAIGW